MHSVALADLPQPCLHLISVKLSPMAASRSRSTCQLLKQVVDATWEPADAPIPPHKRTVPLSLEEVQAQLPPHAPWGPKWLAVAATKQAARAGIHPVDPSRNSSSSADAEIRFDEVCPFPSRYRKVDNDNPFDFDQPEEWLEPSNEHGRHPFWLAMWGPALTCLTANQALNCLPGKPLVCWLGSLSSDLCKFSTVQERVQELEQLTFDDSTRQQWPPENRHLLDHYEFYGQHQTAAGREPCSLQVTASSLFRVNNSHSSYTTFVRCWLLATSSSTCRDATDQERQQFVGSTAASDADMFDAHLSISRDLAAVYVFLKPTARHITGRPRQWSALEA